MLHHIGIVKKAGVTPVVCISSTRIPRPELEMAEKAAEAAGARAAAIRTVARAAKVPPNWQRRSSKPAMKNQISSSSIRWK
jgi:hypothetical protein